MKKENSPTESFADSMLWIGIGMAIFFWLFQALIQMFSTGEFSISGLLFGRDIYDFYNRGAVLVLFIFFGSHAQYNIKQRRKAEMALRGSEDRYRSILESIEEGYYEIDLEHRLTFYNDAAVGIFGLSRRDLPRLDLRQTMTQEAAVRFEDSLRQTLATGYPAKHVECDLNSRSGFKRIVEFSASISTNAMQKPTGFRGIVRDVTEQRLLERQVIESLKNVKEARTGAILGLAKLAEYRDNDTGRHLERIREYTKVLAEELAKRKEYQDYITSDYIEDLYHSSILHDIGKVGIPDSILLKPGRLTPEEFEVMQTHVILGGNALSAVDSQMRGQSFLSIGKEIAYYHHEKWNGAGYPNGLKALEIPLSARLVSLADVYDAITSKRCYKEPFSHETALEIITNEKGTSFDPELVEAFLANEGEFKRIHAELHND